MKQNLFLSLIGLLLLLPDFSVSPAHAAAQLSVVPVSLIDYQNRQRVDFQLTGLTEPIRNGAFEAWQGGKKIHSYMFETLSNDDWNFALFPLPITASETAWKVVDAQGTVQAEAKTDWAPPRRWTFYILRSSHVDIGLHDSQYKQRKMVVDYFDQAADNVEKFKTYPEPSRFRWFQEGQWIWRNYEQDRSPERVNQYVDKYIRTGLIGVGASYAGNHTQVYGGEELCRSAYFKRDFLNHWGIDLDTMIMADNNGITWPLVNVYCDAGIHNVLFAPNQWNPLSPGPFKPDVWGKYWNPDVGGGASRIVVAWDSGIPMVFFWLGPDEKSRLLVWCAPQYGHAGRYLGVGSNPKNSKSIDVDQLRKFLPTLERQYPYNLWLAPLYQDNEGPGSYSEMFKTFNETWKYPIYRTVGDLSEPFHRLRDNFGERIPTLRGDIASGWSQHPIAAPDLLARKFAADRQLATAETFATIAALVNPKYEYPACSFDRAYEALICNDEHSYGTSDYKGRPVYETWSQHFDWIDKAFTTGKTELTGALKTISEQVKTTEPGVLLFNPTLSPKTSYNPLYHKPVAVPPLGYTFVPVSQQRIGYKVSSDQSLTPPTIENKFYRLEFASDGTIASIFDKELNRELVDKSAPYRVNQLLYSPDNYQTFKSPQHPKFLIGGDPGSQAVAVIFDDCASILKARQITQTVTLPNDEKRIDIENEFNGLYGILNTDRYMHYGYAAFPFAVENANYYAQLNGCVVDPHADQAGLGVEAYCAARDWAAAETPVPQQTAESGNSPSNNRLINGLIVSSDRTGGTQNESQNRRFGVAVIQSDSSLIEFGKIHADKRSFNDHPKNGHIYSYLFNTWLQKHNPGGEQANYQFRYSILSYAIPDDAGDKPGWTTANVETFAQQANNPLVEQKVFQAQPNGTLPESLSFLSVDKPDIQLLTLKAAFAVGQDGAASAGGIIARFHETAGEAGSFRVTLNVGQTGQAKKCSVLEADLSDWNAAEPLEIDKFGYKTVRFPNNPVQLRAASEPTFENGVQDIGTFYTGLIDQPRGWFADSSDTLYLLWGASPQSGLDHYELFRMVQDDSIEAIGSDSEIWTKLADVAPGPYRVVSYEDKGLESDTRYIYRVRAVNKDGSVGRFRYFDGITRSKK